MFIEVPASNLSISKRKSILGVGVNDANYATKKLINGKHVKCPYYEKWAGMITRCYSDKYQKRQPSYIGCSVCREWLVFSNFKVWMQGQKWQGNHLDKDLLDQGNKIYSPEKCIFVSSQVNSLISFPAITKRKYPLGVSMHKPSGKLRSQVSVDGVSLYLGSFDCEDEAFSVYKKFKYKIIKNVAMEQDEPLKSALLNYKIIK